jgi:hypothetical protein
LLDGWGNTRSELDTVIHRSSFKKGRIMKKKSRIEIERSIVSRVKKEMDEPRLTESVRNGLSVRAAPVAVKPVSRSKRA